VFRKKKGKYVDRRGFHPLTTPPPIRYSLAGFKGDIQVNFRDLDIIPYPNRDRHSGGAEPRERDYILEYPDLQDRFERVSTKPMFFHGLMDKAVSFCTIVILHLNIEKNRLFAIACGGISSFSKWVNRGSHPKPRE